jgi:DNA-binding transcriptional regulator YdaS (Cro superfamily)
MDLKSHLASLQVQERDELAAASGTTRGHLQNIVYGLRACSPELASMLERATGGVVTRRDLRPDDWHLIWPELAEPSKEPGHV